MPFPAGSNNPKLKDILKLHYEFANVPNAFSNVVGDGFVYSNNPISQNIRKAFLSGGGRFTSSATALYYSFPLLNLDNIVQDCEVPYTPNIAILEKLESERPGQFTARDFATLGPIGNFLLHETAHCVAYKIGSSPSDKEHAKFEILKALLFESFANTTESIASTYFEQTAIELFMLSKNLYIGIPKKEFNQMVKMIGQNQSIKMLILLYLYSNFLYTKLEKQEESRILGMLEINDKIARTKRFRGTFGRLKKYSFELDQGFRLRTTALYFKRMGFSKRITDLLNFDPLRVIDQSRELQEIVNKMAAVLM